VNDRSVSAPSYEELAALAGEKTSLI